MAAGATMKMDPRGRLRLEYDVPYTMKGMYQCAGWSYPGFTDFFLRFFVSEVDQAAYGPDPYPDYRE